MITFYATKHLSPCRSPVIPRLHWLGVRTGAAMYLFCRFRPGQCTEPNSPADRTSGTLLSTPSWAPYIDGHSVPYMIRHNFTTHTTDRSRAADSMLHVRRSLAQKIQVRHTPSVLDAIN